MIRAGFIEEPELEFGYSGRHQEQRAGLVLHGPADIEVASRPTDLRLGMIGVRRDMTELQRWLELCARGVAAREDTALNTLFPAFPGTGDDAAFRVELTFPSDAQRELTQRRLRPISDAQTEAQKTLLAADILSEEVHALLEDVGGRRSHRATSRDSRRRGGRRQGWLQLPRRTEGQVHHRGGADSGHPATNLAPRARRRGRGDSGLESADRALLQVRWQAVAARPRRNRRTRCFVGISFTRADSGDQLHTSVAQVFNELGDGVVVRGALARRSGKAKSRISPSVTRAICSPRLSRATASITGTRPRRSPSTRPAPSPTPERRGFSRQSTRHGSARST